MRRESERGNVAPSSAVHPIPGGGCAWKPPTMTAVLVQTQSIT